MKRGTIGLFGPGPVDILPTFASAGRHRFPFLTIYLRRLKEWGFPVPLEVFSRELERYNGDLVEAGQGEILMC
jgi:formylmethanofuran dehydrogenase subunit C